MGKEFESNNDRIEAIRQEVENKMGRNDVEVFARMFEDRDISDDGTVKGRLKVILDATEHYIIPGLQTGGDFSDTGFDEQFRYPEHESSRDQVGHCLTAVFMASDPDMVQTEILGNRLRDLVGAPETMDNEEVAIRLIVGHEKAPDPSWYTTILGGISGAFGLGTQEYAIQGAINGAVEGYRQQFESATDADVEAFRGAASALGSGTTLDMEAAKAHLSEIDIDPTMRGCSVEDLKLSLVCWDMGKRIISGSISCGDDAASYIRNNIAAPENRECTAPEADLEGTADSIVESEEMLQSNPDLAAIDTLDTGTEGDEVCEWGEGEADFEGIADSIVESEEMLQSNPDLTAIDALDAGTEGDKVCECGEDEGPPDSGPICEEPPEGEEQGEGPPDYGPIYEEPPAGESGGVWPPDSGLICEEPPEGEGEEPEDGSEMADYECGIH